VVRGDPGVAHSAKDAARVLLSAAGVHIGSDAAGTKAHENKGSSRRRTRKPDVR
jgi:hypothetical protein